MRARLLALALLPLSAHAQDLGKLRKEIEAARKASPVPGLSLAVVKDGEVILAEGFGWADVAKRRRATADTVYEIGSVTKSFTALLAAQAEREGKLSLKDRPTKYLPAFRLKDKDANEKITLEDMLSHRSGLPRTDVLWYASDFSRDDLLRVVADAEPTAPLGKAWQYQNLMFLFMGMVEEKAYGKPYETLLQERYFTPLGMAHSASTYAATKAEPLLATGYSGSTKPLPLKEADRIAPAGAVSSSANDMARYVKMLLAEGEFEGKRLFAKEAVEETRNPRIAMAPGATQAYGLGWMLGEDDGVKRVFHGGNIDGFTALVTLLPEKGIGVVALSNGDVASLPAQATELVLAALLPKKPGPKVALVEAAPTEMGAYRIAAPPIDIAFEREGKTTFLLQSGAKIPLELVGPKRYTIQKVLYVTFGEKTPDGRAAVKIEQAGMTFLLPAAQPFKAPVSAEEVLAMTVRARGGADAIRSHARSVVHFHARLPSDAVDLYGVRYHRDAVSQAEYTQLYGLNRRFAEVVESTDGARVVERTSFRATDVKTGAGAADAALSANVLADLEPARYYKSLAILREDKVGAEPVWVLQKTPFAGGKITDYVSKSDGRTLRRNAGSGASAGSTDFSDFRSVDGLVLPFRKITTTATGTKTVEIVDRVRFDEYIPDWPFRG